MYFTLYRLVNYRENHFVLKFTYEIGLNNKLPFLDVLIDGQSDNYETSVYRKNTDAGRCLNADSECPQRYKLSVIKSYIRRAHKNCSNWMIFHQEVEKFKQILVNNGYKNIWIDTELRNFLDKINNNVDNTNKEIIKVFYKNQMNTAYKTDEKVLKDIIKRNVRCIKDNDELQLVIYYKNPKVNNLLMKNNPNKDRSPLKSTNVIYEYSCPKEDCTLLNTMKYIGMTTNDLSRRLTMHLREGAPKSHMTNHHGTTLTRDHLVNNTRILKRCPDFQRLQIYEALYINQIRPHMNLQMTGTHKILTLFNENQHTTMTTTPANNNRPSLPDLTQPITNVPGNT